MVQMLQSATYWKHVEQPLGWPVGGAKRVITTAEQYEKALEIVREQFRIAESFSTGNRTSWLQEVERLLNLAKSELM